MNGKEEKNGNRTREYLRKEEKTKRERKIRKNIKRKAEKEGRGRERRKRGDKEVRELNKGGKN